MEITRAQFLKGVSFAAAAGLLPSTSFAQNTNPSLESPKLTLEDLRAAQKLMDVSFSDEDLKSILQSVQSTTSSLKELREQVDQWDLQPSMTFRVSTPIPKEKSLTPKLKPSITKRPISNDDIAFLSLTDLAELLRSRQITSVELTKLYIARLKKYGPKLRCVAALMEERALMEATIADANFAKNKILSPLQGIPYGVKDLFAAKGAMTQWGSSAYIGQTFDQDSDVIQKLSKAGAVLVAKLSLGALAMNDVWYEGRTESPWNAKIGASGSSAGSASATAAGLVAFAIGTETSGSIVSPSHNCRVVGLRPTFGSVSRAGGMTLCWSLDKAGPICRSANDCAIVFSQIIGYSKSDLSSIDRPFSFAKNLNPARLKIGYLVTDEKLVNQPINSANKPHLEALIKLGATLVPIFLPPAPDGMDVILSGECAASFDSFTTGEKAQIHKENAWPSIFRAARFIAASDYIQADRYRTILEAQYNKALANCDVLIADDRVYPRVFALNCTGHPQALVPLPMEPNNTPRSFSIIASHFQESKILGMAQTMLEYFKVNTEKPNMTIWE